MTRRGCLAGVAIWLLVMTLPICALMLAVRGELSWRRGPLVEDRLWLVRAEADGGHGETAAGLAYAATRQITPAGAAGLPAGTVCARTRVYFFLWRGQSEAVGYCECYQPGAAGYDFTGSCP